VERLKALDAALQQTVDRQQTAGVVMMMARHGKLVAQKAFGLQSIERQKEMQQDTVFRIYSMTKPITGTAMMILYEEGKWKPDDPIAKYIPQFANLKVYAGTGKHGKPKLEAPVHSPTMGELMSHTAGFAYGFTGDLIDSLYKKSGISQARSLEDFIAKLARLPLAYQPGEAWRYSVAADVQGYLVEKLSGEPFPTFVRGTEVRLTVDEAGFVGSGLRLFAQVMDHFFALYVHANSFTQLKILSARTREELVVCPRRSGDSPLV